LIDVLRAAAVSRRLGRLATVLAGLDQASGATEVQVFDALVVTTAKTGQPPILRNEVITTEIVSVRDIEKRALAASSKR